MMIRISLTVDVDPDAWATEYGLDSTSREAIRTDVREHVQSSVRDHLSALGLLSNEDHRS